MKDPSDPLALEKDPPPMHTAVPPTLPAHRRSSGLLVCCRGGPGHCRADCWAQPDGGPPRHPVHRHRVPGCFCIAGRWVAFRRAWEGKPKFFFQYFLIFFLEMMYCVVSFTSCEMIVLRRLFLLFGLKKNKTFKHLTPKPRKVEIQFVNSELIQVQIKTQKTICTKFCEQWCKKIVVFSMLFKKYARHLLYFFLCLHVWGGLSQFFFQFHWYWCANVPHIARPRSDCFRGELNKFFLLTNYLMN